MRAFKDTQIVLMTREESIRIYKTYSRKLFNVSFRIVGDSALAEEIMQDTVLKFFRFVGEGERADRDGDVGDSSLALRMTGGPLRMTGDVAGRKATEAGLGGARLWGFGVQLPAQRRGCCLAFGRVWG